MITETIAAYSAGIIDGDGSILVAKRKKRFSSRVIVGQSERRWELLDFLASIFVGAELYGPYQSSLKNRSRTKLIIWNGEYAVNLIGIVRPYLLLKTKQADLVVHFQEMIRAHKLGGRICWRNNLLDKALVYHKKSRQLNEDGILVDEEITPILSKEPIGLFEW